jgi:hypothetical protein
LSNLTWNTSWTRPGRHTQPVRHRADALQDLERPCVARTQRPLGSLSKRQSLAMKEAEPDPITDAKLQLAMMGVVVLLGILLGLEKTITNLREEGVPIP